MSEVNGGWDSRAEAIPTDPVEVTPLVAERPEAGGEFYHQIERTGRPNLDIELGHASLAGYEDVPSVDDTDVEVHDIWDRRNEPEGTVDVRAGGESSEGAELHADDEVYDIWDRRNESAGSINLRNFGR